MYAPEVYAKAASMLQDMIRDGLFIEEDKEAYYVYELIMNGRSQTGICACASVDDYERQVIRKHENTRAEKEADRIRHVDVCSAQTGPIFLAYRRRGGIEEVVRDTVKKCPVYDFRAEDGVTHRLWIIQERDKIDRIRHEFGQVGSIYIADGHHRCASAVKVSLMRRDARPGYTGEEEFNYFLSVLFPDDQLMIMDYNRAVKDLNGLTEEAFLSKVAEIFEVGEAEACPIKPDKKGVFTMCLQGRWYRCAIKPEDRSGDPVKGLDVSILQEKLLAPVLQIKDPKTDKIGRAHV